MDVGAWPQYLIEFPDAETAERVAAEHLGPALADAVSLGLITRWAFLRKRPAWRLRYRPRDRNAGQYMAAMLNRLATDGRISRWRPGIYEPETVAFGGAAAMEVAHTLFHHDSGNILTYLAHPGTVPLGRNELAVLLASVLMRAAGQDWYEQGDIWHRLTEHRPTNHTPVSGDPDRVRAATYRLMTVDAGPDSALLTHGALTGIAAWSAAFDQAGRQLSELARHGVMERGLRAVLTHHLIFFFNRLGLPYATQHTLSALAKEIVMTDPHHETTTPEPGTGPANLTPANADTIHTHAEATRLRDTLVDTLRAGGTIRTGAVEAAMRTVPRHLFVPGVSLETAYSDEAVYTKHDGAGTQISAASQPTIVAMMLEQLDIEPGQRILEIGAGTGYNAALLAHQTGPTGEVITIDVDEDIVTEARAHLTTAGIDNVRVIVGDGALGHADSAPYDKVIATVGAWDLPPAWLNQTAPGGRIVVPLRLRGSVSRSLVLERDAQHRWQSRTSEMCTFMPLRASIADDTRHIIPLTPDNSVTLWTNQEQTVDPETLTGIFDHSPSRTWTGVHVRGDESFEWLHLWLTCTTEHGLSQMPTTPAAIEAGLVEPQFRWGAMATARKTDLAYLTTRPADGRYEIGVIGHGPGADELTHQLADQIRTWDRDYRTRPVEFELQLTDSTEPPPNQQPGTFVFDRPKTRLIIRWQ